LSGYLYARSVISGAICRYTTLTGRNIIAVHVLPVRRTDDASIRLRATPIAVSGAVHASHARGARVLALVAGHAVHAVLDRNRVGQVRSSGGITTSGGAFLEMPLENITARKGVVAGNTLVRTFASVCAMGLV
jgi:hypothetical protein